MEKLLARIPPELIAKYIEKLAERTPPGLILTLAKELLSQGLKTDFKLSIGPIEVRGEVVLKSPP